MKAGLFSNKVLSQIEHITITDVMNQKDLLTLLMHSNRINIEIIRPLLKNIHNDITRVAKKFNDYLDELDNMFEKMYMNKIQDNINDEDLLNNIVYDFYIYMLCYKNDTRLIFYIQYYKKIQIDKINTIINNNK